ncbi:MULTISPECIES: hypothetical protein [Nostoc]|uniref:hypothetical protein n=1 Tax=Nostoc TaxID=1177 RepID=UPI00187EA9A3|nr:hypothetical protein [Nostoc sp. LEGE 12450]MBE8991514.1 hypothetical protein [Nostoc sp. LEGE 12450]
MAKGTSSPNSSGAFQCKQIDQDNILLQLILYKMLGERSILLGTLRERQRRSQ